MVAWLGAASLALAATDVAPHAVGALVNFDHAPRETVLGLVRPRPRERTAQALDRSDGDAQPGETCTHAAPGPGSRTPRTSTL
jgi:hypothetical protein